jgi:dTDP-4-amino-4,6-dideoxygalactose transaminase
MRSTFLPFGVPAIGEDEIAEVTATLRSRWIGTGPRSQQFEREFAEYVGARHALALNSGSAALFLSLRALGIGRGDEVVTTPLTFAATANAIEHVGARPVFADIDPETLNIDLAAISRAVTSRTKAILPVHFGGLPCDLDAIQALRLPVVEDAAHAVGASYHGRMIGGIGKLTCFSFYANKNLTTAEGGMVTTDDAELAAKIRILRMHGLSADAWKRFSNKGLLEIDVRLPGYKFNMPDLAAALGLPQLRKQEEFLAVRERYAARYDAAFQDLPFLRQRRDPRHALHLYVLILAPGRWSASRNQVVETLLQQNIGAAIHYRPLHMEPYYRRKYRFQPEDFPVAHRVGASILSLPLSPAMTEEDVSDVIDAVHLVADRYCSRRSRALA